VTVMRVFALILALITLIAARANAAQYPENPLQVGDSIVVSHQGVYRFDSSSGEPLWSSLPGIETFAPVAYGDLLLVGSTQGLYGLRLDDGEVAWRIDKQHTLFSPSIADNTAYAGSVHGELFSLKPGNGVIAWRKPFDGWIYSPTISADSTQLWTGGQAHEVYALASRDGRVLRKIATSQESVFGAVDLGNAQVAFNLFDGSTLVLDSNSRQIVASLAGDSQPTGIAHQGGVIFRSHSDGSLSAFSRDDMEHEWQRSLTPHNLVFHPSLPGYLLLGDRDSKLLLLDLANNTQPCELDGDGQRLLPMQLDTRRIIFFRKTMQPPGLKLVKFPAICI
jgi:outer membrane protein assembly factor BamB